MRVAPLSVLVVGFMAGFAASAAGQPIALTNPSFESPDDASGTSGGAFTGWLIAGGTDGTIDRNSGVFAANIDPTPDPFDAEQLYWSNNGVHYQVLGATLAANTTYVLSADFGHRIGLAFGGGNLRLGFGTSHLNVTFLAPIGVVNPTPINGPGASDGWERWTFTRDTGASPAGLGQSLLVFIRGFDTQTLIDNVDLTVVPAPGAVGLLGLGGLAMMRRRR